MPAVDAVPFLLAEKNGYFSELGLNAELQIFSNAQDRQFSVSLSGKNSTLRKAAETLTSFSSDLMILRQYL